MSTKQPDYFELLGLSRQAELDLQELETRWKARAAAVHPDRFTQASDAEKRIAMQWSAQINEAYRVLRDPLKRLAYLCELAGFRVGEGSGGSVSTPFLMHQMQWRDDLEEISQSQNAQALAELVAEVLAKRAAQQRAVVHEIEQQRWESAVTGLHEWMFIDKFVQELRAVERNLVKTG